jgi:hypothetical protein
MFNPHHFVVMAALLLVQMAAATAQQHQHHASGDTVCATTALACATAATATIAPDGTPGGTLFLTWAASGHVLVARSTDLGHSFEPAVAVTTQPAKLDNGPDSRPQIVVDPAGTITVAYALFRDKAWNGEVFFSRSQDQGRSFSPPQPITAGSTSERFQALALDPNGRVFAAWIDKRNAARAKERGEKYAGAALAFAWSDGDGFTPTRIAQDNTCECCRLGIAFAGPSRPVVLFRNVFPGSERDHAVIAFSDAQTPGPVQRVSDDAWAVDACPHHGPSLAIGQDGAIHAAWFTQGKVRQGLFYARSGADGAGFSAPLPIGDPDRQPTRPSLLAAPGRLLLAWKEFDGTTTQVRVMASTDNGRSFTAPRTVASTADASDHPLLIGDGQHAYLSWLTHNEGYRLMPLQDGNS